MYVHQIRRSWKQIVGVKKSFNPKSHQLVAWEHSMLEIPEEDNLEGHLNQELWHKVVQKAKPWKAHRSDGLHGYWWKVFSSANAALYQLIFCHMTSGILLPRRWITDGRIVLIHKSGSRSEPANFRSISCLNTCYKLLTGFIAAYLNQYVKEREILPSEQVTAWRCVELHTRTRARPDTNSGRAISETETY